MYHFSSRHVPGCRKYADFVLICTKLTNVDDISMLRVRSISAHARAVGEVAGVGGWGKVKH